MPVIARDEVRQSGKSTLDSTSRAAYRYANLEDCGPGLPKAKGFLFNLGKRVIIDEVALRPIFQVTVDREKTGSLSPIMVPSNLLLMKRLPKAWASRVSILSFCSLFFQKRSRNCFCLNQL